jgi:alpha-beta hydrolase superfamily lysophospholipase
MAKPTILVVPGAFHKPIHYSKLINKLQLGGYDVLPITHKSSSDKAEDVNIDFSHFDDAAAILSKLQPLLNEGKEVVLVSHSYGSLPTTACVEGNTTIERAGKGLKGGIKAVINIAGFAFPARGKNAFGTDDPTFNPLEYHTLEVRKNRQCFCSNTNSG